MIARAGSGWQTVLADLSLILFMVTASVLAASPDPLPAVDEPSDPSEQSEPLAVFVPADGPPTLVDWIAAQSPDERQQLTILARYEPGGQAAAVQAAAELLGDAGKYGAGARVVVEPGGGGVSAVLAYDVPETALAWALRKDGHNSETAKDSP